MKYILYRYNVNKELFWHIINDDAEIRRFKSLIYDKLNNRFFLNYCLDIINII